MNSCCTLSSDEYRKTFNNSLIDMAMDRQVAGCFAGDDELSSDVKCGEFFFFLSS